MARSLLRERGLAPLNGGEHTCGGGAIRAARALLAPRAVAQGTGAGHAPVRNAGARRAQPSKRASTCLSSKRNLPVRARCFAAVRARVLEGQSLSHSLAEFPNAFPQIYRAMIEAGEQSGRLGDVLERLADYTENREALRDQVIIAFIYPVLLTVVAFLVIAFLVAYVVPQVTRVFANLGQTLPLVTRRSHRDQRFCARERPGVARGTRRPVFAGALLLRDESRNAAGTAGLLCACRSWED